MRHVYFVKPVGLDGPIKIGWSKRPLFRLDDMACGSPLHLELVGSVPGAELDERFIHDCFADHHSHREWYHSSPKLRSAIAQVLHAGTVAVLRGVLIPQKNMRAAIQQRKPLTSDRRRFLSYNVRAARRRNHPADIAKILRAWGDAATPNSSELARLDAYLGSAA